jgi:MFS family permease
MARFAWWREASPESRRALVAASLGWMLDSFDVMLWAFVVTAIMRDLRLTTRTAGLLGSLTLAASAVGGLVFGRIADRFGRRWALMASIAIYSIFTAACGLSTGIVMLAIFRVFLGLGMGGEWASGAALVSELWPAAHRGKALGIVQSSWAVGYGLAAAVYALVLPVWGWRGVFFVGVAPAFFTLWIQKKVREPEIWQAARVKAAKAGSPALKEIFGRGRLRLTLFITLMNACTMFGWWGFNLWLPAYLSLAPKNGGIGLAPGAVSALVIVMQAGMWSGYITFGFISDRLGRKRSYVIFLAAAAAFMLLYSRTREPLVLFALGPLVAFFGTGYFTGFGALTAEIYPTSVRATAQGLTYNAGRIVSAAAPLVVGSLAQTKGFSFSFGIVAAAFLAAAVLWAGIPETRGRPLE